MISRLEALEVEMEELRSKLMEASLRIRTDEKLGKPEEEEDKQFRRLIEQEAIIIDLNQKLIVDDLLTAAQRKRSGAA